MRYFLLIVAVALVVSSCDVVKATQLEQAVTKALAADSRTSDFNFEVSLQENGEVLITGEVYSAQQVAAVAEIAAAVEGVEKVLNRVHVEEAGSGMMQDHVVPSPFM